MFGSRRLAKRSIIGTRVCAPWTDGKYYPGVIQSTQTWPNGEEVYTVSFDGGFNKVVQDKELIGPGFQTIMSAKLKKGQKVFITYNGREVSGEVEHHSTSNDNVFITMDLPNCDDELEIDRKLEEIRLVPSRKSSRLQKQDMDYCKMADMPSGESKKRAVSTVIDVPSPVAKQSRRRKSVSSPTHEVMEYEEEGMEEEAEEPEEPQVMNEHMAAMVLTALSCSPSSPSFPPHITDKGASPCGGSSFASSGVWGLKSGSRTPSLGTPSPPQLSSSAPVGVGTLFGTPPVDEGIELDETAAYFSEEPTPRKRRAPTRTVFKCTWPNCGKLYNTINGIERHVRCEHLGPKESTGDEYESDDHEEEFYYTELEVTVDTMTATFADMYTSSPPPATTTFIPVASPLPDHDYSQKKSFPMSIPSSSSRSDHQRGGSSYPGGGITSLSISIPQQPQMSRSLSWQPPTNKLSKTSPSTSKAFSQSPKSSPLHKKTRSDTKKCRKVYGMENRDMWCTQCKWKKACTRFMD